MEVFWFVVILLGAAVVGAIILAIGDTGDEGELDKYVDVEIPVQVHGKVYDWDERGELR